VSSGASNVTGSSNTVIGANADVGAGNLVFATAIGAGAVVSSSNQVVIGRSSDTVRVPGDLFVGTASDISFSTFPQDGGVPVCATNVTGLFRLSRCSANVDQSAAAAAEGVSVTALRDALRKQQEQIDELSKMLAAQSEVIERLSKAVRASRHLRTVRASRARTADGKRNRRR
jgi:hypothetical protein